MPQGPAQKVCFWENNGFVSKCNRFGILFDSRLSLVLAVAWFGLVSPVTCSFEFG
jgi:hypothetical protein